MKTENEAQIRNALCSNKYKARSFNMGHMPVDAGRATCLTQKHDSFTPTSYKR